MTNKSNLESLGKVEHKKLSSLAEDSSSERNMPLGREHRANRSIKTAKSKREMMEELSRERFPWEE